MATYRSISNTEYSVDAPLTTQLVQAIDENATAITEGASGAPRVTNEAISANANTTSAGIEAAVMSCTAPYVTTTQNTTYKVMSGKVNIAGEYRFNVRAVCYAANSGCNFSMRLYIGGVQRAIYTDSNNSVNQFDSPTLTYDGTVAEGDEWYLNVTGDNGGARSLWVFNVTAQTASRENSHDRITNGAIFVN